VKSIDNDCGYSGGVGVRASFLFSVNVCQGLDNPVGIVGWLWAECPMNRNEVHRIQNTGRTQKNYALLKVIEMYFSSYTGTTHTISSGNCPCFSCATSSSLPMLTVGPRDQFPRWSRSMRRLSVCSVLRCPDLWLQCSVSFVYGLKKNTLFLYGSSGRGAHPTSYAVHTGTHRHLVSRLRAAELYLHCPLRSHVVDKDKLFPLVSLAAHYHKHGEESSWSLNVAIFWDVAPCSPYVNWRFVGTYNLHLQGRKSAELENSAQLVARLSQNMATFKTSAVRTSNLAWSPEVTYRGLEFLARRCFSSCVPGN
jgi:hypothetical protein